ncbi:MAG: MFS transporter [Clostridia bacterium]|nr:MFS transporter [Clostridia bacterium]
MKFTKTETAAFGLGAVGKDMVYALASSYVLYYYQDVLGLSAAFVGLILMIARIFDAANDPFMGIVVAKTNTRFGRFRPWIITGTVLNALVLYFLFAAPDITGAPLMVWFSAMYILWGVTYTMMDIPYWSMIPAVTSDPKERENLSVVGRSCASVGNALVAVFTLMAVSALGGGSERTGFARLALIIAVLFVIAEMILFMTIKEKRSETETKTGTVREMIQALARNDQAMVTVITIILVNSAMYITMNLIIYFFKYDFGGADWIGSYTTFNMVGGLGQILGMTLVYPLMHRKMPNQTVFRTALALSIAGYLIIMVMCLTGLGHSLVAICIPGMLVFCMSGILVVLTTVFLSGTVDYGEIRTGRREESVIFSMQTFVVKAASGLSVFIAGLGISLIGLKGNADQTAVVAEVQSASAIAGLRFLMTLLPAAGLIIAMIVFVRHFKLTDERMNEIANQLKERRNA